MNFTDECTTFVEGDRLASGFYWRREEDPAKKQPRPSIPTRYTYMYGLEYADGDEPGSWHSMASQGRNFSLTRYSEII